MDVNKEEPPLENPSLSNSSTCFHLDIRYVLKVQINRCPCKGLLHAKPSASVNTALLIGGICATDKLRRVELYREEVSNKQLYICILSDVSCRCTDNRKSVKHFSSFESIRPSLLLVGSVSTFVFRYLRQDCSGFFLNDRMRK